MARQKPSTTRPTFGPRKGSRYAPNGTQGTPICCAGPRLADMIAAADGRLVVNGFGQAVRTLAAELAATRYALLRIVVLSAIPEASLKSALRRHPDAFEIDREARTVRLFEAEDTSLLTEEKLLDYANLTRIAELLAWEIELVIIDRYGNLTRHDPEDLYTMAVSVQTADRERTPIDEFAQEEATA